MIYHVTTGKEWDTQKEAPDFVAASLRNEGFIHCSTREQVAGVVDRYFRDAGDLVLLHIDEDRLTSPCMFEPSTGGEFFPHVYGPINKNAVVSVLPYFDR
jgi:uncharacterized protein (DUF952 family)